MEREHTPQIIINDRLIRSNREVGGEGSHVKLWKCICKVSHLSILISTII